MIDIQIHNWNRKVYIQETGFSVTMWFDNILNIQNANCSEIQNKKVTKQIAFWRFKMFIVFWFNRPLYETIL